MPGSLAAPSKYTLLAELARRFCFKLDDDANNLRQHLSPYRGVAAVWERRETETAGREPEAGASHYSHAKALDEARPRRCQPNGPAPTLRGKSL